MQPPLSTPTRVLLQQAAAFLLLTVQFTALNYMGTAVYELAGGLTTVKPYGGVALALVLILGERWLVAKLASSASLGEALATPIVTSATLLVVHLVTRQLIGSKPDFRAWRQLVGFIAVAALISAGSAFSFVLIMEGVNAPRFWIDLQAWLIPTALSYVIFTPVMMLLATADHRVLLN